MSEMERPTFSMSEQNRFSLTEVGVTHQFTNAFVRLADNGDVELVAGEGLAIILHAANRSITFMADKVKFVTPELTWNKLRFNERATKFTEPAFTDWDPEDGLGIFRNMSTFLEDDDEE